MRFDVVGNCLVMFRLPEASLPGCPLKVVAGDREQCEHGLNYYLYQLLLKLNEKGHEWLDGRYS